MTLFGIIRLVNELHELNASLPMLVNELESVMLVKPDAPKMAFPILVTVSGIIMLFTVVVL